MELSTAAFAATFQMHWMFTKSMWALAGLPVTTCYNQASLLLAVYCVYCVIETKASLLYCLSTVHNVYHLSVALSVTRYHNMAVNEADLIASQILKEFVISKWNKTNNECSILRRFSDFNLKEVLKIQECEIHRVFRNLDQWIFQLFKATSRIFFRSPLTSQGKSNNILASCQSISPRLRPEFRDLQHPWTTKFQALKT